MGTIFFGGEISSNRFPWFILEHKFYPYGKNEPRLHIRQILAIAEWEVKLDMAEDTGNLSRRRFFKLGVGTLSGLIGISYIGLIGKFLVPPPAGTEPLAEVGKIYNFSEGTPKLVSYKNGGVEQGVYVVNLGNTNWLALDFHCTHLQCAVNWFDPLKSFVCPCHGGVYDIQGHVKSGPPPRSLSRRIIQIQGDSVLVGGSLV